MELDKLQEVIPANRMNHSFRLSISNKIERLDAATPIRKSDIKVLGLEL